MRALRDYILNEIKTRLPDLRDVRMWNNQFNHSNNDDTDLNDEEAFDYPCCFVEFEIQETRPVSLGVVYVDLLIRLHLGIENYSDERPLDYDVIDNVSQAMHGMRGSSTDTVQFSSLQESNIIPDTEFNNITVTVLEYRTTYSKLTAYTRVNNVDKLPPTGLNITSSIS